jgi:hypothetical protein
MQDVFSPFRGGESEALKRLRESIADKVWCITHGEFWLKKTKPAFLLSIYLYIFVEMIETYSQLKGLWFFILLLNILLIYLFQDLIYGLIVTCIKSLYLDMSFDYYGKYSVYVTLT